MLRTAPPETALTRGDPAAAKPTRHSVSSLTTYEQCPQRWWFKYGEKVRLAEQASPWHFRFGAVIHAGLEAAYLARKAGDPPAEGFTPGTMEGYLPAGEAGARASWEREFGEAVGGDWHEAMRQVGLSLSACELPPADHVLGVEHKLLVDTPGGTPMVGFLDLVESVAPETVRVRDWKSNSSPMPLEALGQDFQLTAYAALVRRQWPWVRLVYATQFHTPLGYENAVLVTEEAQEDTLARIDAVAEMIEVDEVAPRRGPACSGCPFLAICPAWADDREAASEISGF